MTRMPTRATRVRKPRRGQPPAAPGASGENVSVRDRAWTIHFGDLIKIERRYIVEGSLTSVTDRGRFGGVQLLGGAEHLVLENKADVRMIPLHTVSEIVLEDTKGPDMGPAFDPSYQ